VGGAASLLKVGGDTESELDLTFRRDERGVVWITWPPGVHITGALAQEAMDRLDVFNDGHKRPTLVEMSGIAGIDRAGRQVFTGECAASRMALVGRRPVERVLANFALAASRHAVPMRFFATEEAAVEWLTRAGPDR
jgi:hypothetical protein